MSPKAKKPRLRPFVWDGEALRYALATGRVDELLDLADHTGECDRRHVTTAAAVQELALLDLGLPGRFEVVDLDTPKELRALGAHPESGAPVKILDGRYGPYVTDGTTNASLPKGVAPEALTMDEAKTLLEARAGAAKPSRRRGAKRPAAKAGKTARKGKGSLVGA